MEPKVSILWLNYNSSDFIDLVTESLEAIKNIDYGNYELIVADNGSTDGSFETIVDFINRTKLNSKLVRLKRNLGFTGGNNAAYAARDRDAKYVVLLNNDAVPMRGSLRELVSLMEADGTLGASQGVISYLDEKTVDTAGDYLTEMLTAASLLNGKSPQSLEKPVFVTSADAAYSIFRTKAVDSIPDQEKCLFSGYLFGCFDDHMLGLKLWNAGFKIKAFPIITAKHRRGASFNKAPALQTYLYVRNMLIINEVSNSRYKNLIKLLWLKQLPARFFGNVLGLILDNDSKESPSLIARAFIDGIRIGRVRRKVGEAIDIYKAPVLQIRPLTAFLGTVLRMNFFKSNVREQLDKIVLP